MWLNRLCNAWGPLEVKGSATGQLVVASGHKWPWEQHKKLEHWGRKIKDTLCHIEPKPVKEEVVKLASLQAETVDNWLSDQGHQHGHALLDSLGKIDWVELSA